MNKLSRNLFAAFFMQLHHAHFTTLVARGKWNVVVRYSYYK